MKRLLLIFVVGLYLAAVGPFPPRAGGEAIGPFKGPNRDLSVVGGKVLFVRPSGQGFNWELSLAVDKGSTEVQFAGGGRWHGWFLRFNPKGKDPTVTLAKTKGPGTQWEVTRVKISAATYTIQATHGKFKGWYLTLAFGKGVKLADRIGREYTAYRADLSKTPKRTSKFSIYEVAK